MNQSSYPNEVAANQFSKGQSSRTFARLMRPSEVAEATKNYPKEVQDRIAGHWLLCGDVSSKMFRLLKAVSTRYFPTRVTGFKSSTGYGYGVFTHQVGGHGIQSRFVMCLSDPRVREFLASMATDKVSFMLGNDCQNDALVLECPLNTREINPLLAMSYEATKDEQKEAMWELPLVLEAVTNRLQVPSLFVGQPVRQVDVSFLLPSILDEQVGDALRNATRK